MTTHELAKVLLETENLPVVINGWGSDEGSVFEVLKVTEPFTESTACLGFEIEQKVIALQY